MKSQSTKYYRNYADVATLEARIRDLVVARKMDREIARAVPTDYAVRT
jgi:hypothetical protein